MNFDLFGGDPVPDVARPSDEPSNLANLIGAAGEHLVMYRLLRWRVPAVWEANSPFPHDILVLAGSRACRIQVKATLRPAPANPTTCHFNNSRGAYATLSYDAADYDIAALVLLSLDRVIFKHGVYQSRALNLPTSLFLQDGAERLTWDAAYGAWAAAAL